MSKNVKKELSSPGYGNQETLQAIVFADDFIHDLKPSNELCPSILLPVVSSPLFNYLLETLVHSRVQQVFLYCSNQVDKLKTFVESLKYFQDKSIVITPIISDGCRSLGDALRDLDTKGFIRGDFLLIRGTAFINADLRSLMDLHKSKKEKDKNTAMTMIFRDLGNLKDSELKDEASVVVSNATTRKLLHYKKLEKEKKIDLELQWFLEHDKVHINTALLDTRVYLCSQSVLPLFADNFDFQTIEDFIRGVLMNEEFLDSRIYWETLSAPNYALPISSWKSYQMLCRDILQRQSYPLVPDTLPLCLRDFIYMSRSTYKHPSSTLSKGCTLHSESIVGENSILGVNSLVKRSIIGPNCIIGTNVNINNSYIISGTVIEDDCEIDSSIIFPNCTLAKGTKLNSCLLSSNVKCAESHSNIFFENNDDGKAVSQKMANLDITEYNFASAFLDNEDDDDCDASSTLSVSSAWSSPSSRESRAPQEFQDDNDMFLTEVIDSLLRGYQDKLKCENLILEINSSRYAYNVSIQQVSYNVIKAILNLPIVQLDPNSKLEPTEYQRALKPMLTYFKPIIANYIKTENAQGDCLRAIQDVAYTHDKLVIPFTQNILHFFYDNDILLEEKIIEWYEEDGEDLNEDEDDNGLRQKVAEAIRTAIAPFIKWLKEAEEDSDEESDESS